MADEVDTVEAEALNETPYARHGNPISLRSLDLTKPPTETQLRLAGQLGSALTPNREAKPAKIKDRAKRDLQEKDNLLFGEAMNQWNRHEYKEAVKIFRKHQAAFGDSAWSGEVDLHMGCEAQFNGRWDEARGHFQKILGSAERGSDIYQKAKLRLSVLLLEQGQVEESVKSFAEMLKTEKTWERTTYAQNWIRQLAVLEGNLERLRVCGSDSVAFIMDQSGRKKDADALRSKPAHGKYGYTLAELRDVAREAGLNPRAIRATAADLATMPVPFIAHYEDEHYVVVFGRGEDGSLKVFDPRLKHRISMTSDEFAAQWSGLALLTEGRKPKGIAEASFSDLSRVGGCCGIPRPEDDIGPCGEDSKSCRGMPAWQINPINMNMMVQDIPLWYDNSVGPNVEILLTYNSLDALNQLRPFGNKWTFNYLSYAMEGPGGVVTIVMPHGRRDVYSPSGVLNEYTSPMKRAGYTLLKTGTYAYKLTLPDGTQYVYGVPPAMGGGATSSLLLSMKNKSGEALTLTHNATGRLTTITDALSRDTGIFYNAAGLIDHINDPFGRSCSFVYDAEGNLVGQTDMGGLSYSYSYVKKNVQEQNIDGDYSSSNPPPIIANNLFIASITTPSGTTGFYTEPADGIDNGVTGMPGGNAYPQPGTAMWTNYRITVTDPEGSKEEYYFNGYSKYSWHRDGRQYETLQTALAATSTPTDYKTEGLNAPKTMYEFTILGGRGLIDHISYANGNYESLSNFTSNGQPQNVYDGHSSVYTYNSQGQVLTFQNGRGYATTYEYYPNGLDLKKVTRPHTVGGVTNTITVAEYTYDASRRVTSVKDAGNYSTGMTYTARGEIDTVTNARNEVTTYNRNGLHQVTSLTRAGQTIQSYTYDAIGRVATSTDANGTVLTYEYDNLNRRTKVIYSDATFEKFTYTCCGNVESVTDREGQTTNYTYDGNKRLVVMRDPAGRLTQYDYDAAGNLIRLVDGNGNSTRFEYDARNRMNKRIFADTKFEAYVLDASGNRTQVTNARNQTVFFYFDNNDNLYYINGSGVSSSFTYDDLDRRTNMSDASGATVYGYNNLNQLTSVDGPLSGTTDLITYTYDELGRRATQTWGGTQSRTVTYDALGRLATEVNPLGNYGYIYTSAASNLVSQITRPISYSLNYAYAPAPAVRRLSQTQVKQGSAVQAQFDYLYDLDGSITKATESLPGVGLAALEKNYTYDPAEQLLGDVEKLVSSGAVQQKYAYRYDAGANRTGEQIGDAPKKASYNKVNQLTTLAAGGWLRFSGQVNEPATVTVGGKAVSLLPGNKFDANVAVVTGTNTVSVVAKDGAGNVRTNNYQVNVPTATPSTYTYDFDGNMLTDGVRTYTWDALNRVTKITYADNSTTEFTYDGLSRWVKIKEKNPSATITSDKSFVWSGMELVERRDATVATNNRIFLPEGQLRWTGSAWAPVHYVRDHLGSIRELIDSDGVVQTSYAYDPWGRRSEALPRPAPVSGSKVHRSEAFAGVHQHFFQGATATMAVGTGDKLVCWVWIDPKNVPQELMLQWCDGVNWYRAYWGQNLITYGPATYIGAMPAAGGWVRLEVAASLLGMEGKTLNGMAYSLYGGRVWWDAAGKRVNGSGSDTVWVNDAVPTGGSPVATDDTWSWVTNTIDADLGFTGHYFHEKSGLHLAPYRAYAADLGRWISRDPIGEYGGVNLYGYVLNNPVNLWDPLGLMCQSQYDQLLANMTAMGAITGSIIGGVSGGAGGGLLGAPTGPGALITGSAGAAAGALEGGTLGAAAGAALTPAIAGLSDLINQMSGGGGKGGGDGSCPGNNQAQNKQFNDAIKAIEKQIGRSLNKNERQLLHREISGQGQGYHDIIDTGVGMFGG